MWKIVSQKATKLKNLLFFNFVRNAQHRGVVVVVGKCRANQHRGKPEVG